MTRVRPTNSSVVLYALAGVVAMFLIYLMLRVSELVERRRFRGHAAVRDVLDE